MNGRDGDLGGVIGSATLDGEGDDLLSGLMALGLDLLLGLANDRGGFVGHLAANLVEKLSVGVLASELRDALELVRLTGIELLKLTRALVDLTLLAGKLVLSLIKGFIAAIKGLLTLHHSVLEGADLLLTLSLLCLGGLLVLDNLLLGLEEGLLLKGLGRALSVGHHLLGFRMGGGNLRFGLANASGLGVAHGKDGGKSTDCQAHDADENKLHWHDGLLLVVKDARKPHPPIRRAQDICRVWSTEGPMKSFR